MDLLALLMRYGAIRPSTGSAPFKWNLQSAGSTETEIFVEGQAVPTPTASTYQQASLSPFYLWNVVAVTGHVRDNINRGGYYVDPQEAQLREKVQALFYLLETTLLGSTQDRGIASIIDDTDSYAGLLPATVAAWASKETNVAGALAVSTLEDAYEDVTSPPYNAKPTVILANTNQITNYSRLAGVAGGTTPIMRMTAPSQSGQAFDAGMLAVPGIAFNGIPIERVRGLTNTEMYFLDFSADPTTGEPGIQLVMHRDLTVEPLAKTNDNTQALLTLAAALKVANRRRQLKLRGITA
jgi:hypothetical protein